MPYSSRSDFLRLDANRCARASRVPKRALCAALLFAAGFAAGCGYTVAGQATHIPPDVHTIAVLPLVNKTSTYRIEQRMTQAVVRQFLERTKYRIVPTADGADAVLSGEITAIEASAVTYDYTTGRATTMLVTVTMKVRLEDRDHKMLYENDNYLFRQPYEISTDVNSFFQEEGPALDRMSQDFASRLVSDVLENF
jgi:outer membrane lipopolysaccharide assembly protein LptE/RlpB